MGAGALVYTTYSTEYKGRYTCMEASYHIM